jgi:hypothetical protein
MESQAECMLVPIGATPEGRKELVGFQVGVRASTQSWRELLVEVKRRGLTIAPEISRPETSRLPARPFAREAAGPPARSASVSGSSISSG